MGLVSASCTCFIRMFRAAFQRNGGGKKVCGKGRMIGELVADHRPIVSLIIVIEKCLGRET